MRLKAQDDLRAKMKACKAGAAIVEVPEKEEGEIIPLSVSSRKHSVGRIVQLIPMQRAAAATVLIVVSIFTLYWDKPTIRILPYLCSFLMLIVP